MKRSDAEPEEEESCVKALVRQASAAVCHEIRPQKWLSTQVALGSGRHTADHWEQRSRECAELSNVGEKTIEVSRHFITSLTLLLNDSLHI